MSDEMKIITCFVIFVMAVFVVLAGAVKGAKMSTCREFQALYGDVVELETGFLSARCTIGGYKIDGSINDHLYIREYLDE